MGEYCSNCKHAKKVVGQGRHCDLDSTSINYVGDFYSCLDWEKSSGTLKEQIEQIADAYEFNHQAIKLFEEQGELTQALAKLMLDTGPSSEYTADLGNVKEELADVQLMLWQIMYLLDVSWTEIQDTIKAKADRTVGRMEGENDNGI